MKTINLRLLILVIIIGYSYHAKASAFINDESQRDRLFNENWKFVRDNPEGAEDYNFDDSEWRMLDLPHDWSIEDLPNQIKDSIVGPFTKTSPGKMFSGFTQGGIGWYRKSFTIDKTEKDNIFYLRFDGVFMNANVWINGHHVGNHSNGYTPFYYNITPFLHANGKENVVAIQVKNQGRTSRWYSGSGIYRNVWLTSVNPVHVKVWGTYITSPTVSKESSEIEIVTTVENLSSKRKNINLKLNVFNPRGELVGSINNNISVDKNSSTDVKQNVKIDNPELWSVDFPNLYIAEISVTENDTELDRVNTSFGIRSIKVDAKNGLLLNGENILLNGGCIHHDNGPLGAAAIDRAEERKIEILKKEGYNAIRISHNPASKSLLNACDKLGMLVIEEAFDVWQVQKVDNDFHTFFDDWWKKDLQSMILRGRNHPSIIMWSIGNEIPEVADSSGIEIAKNLTSEVRRLDPTRIITEGSVDFANFLGGESTWDKREPHFSLLDVVGVNYGYNIYEEDHKKYPNRIMYSSESMTPLTFENWELVEKLPYVIGNFSWTAMDYLGEAGIGLARLVPEDSDKDFDDNGLSVITSAFNIESWPVFNAFCGEIDLIGNKKPSSYYRDVVIGRSEIEMLVHRPIPEGKVEVTLPWGFPDELKCWSWPGNEGKNIQINVYTRNPVVTLELNGEVVAKQIVDVKNSARAKFEIPYQPGTLTARCYKNGIEIASESIKTVGKPNAVRLVADRSAIKANRNDLAYIQTEIIDSNGNLVPVADDFKVLFEINGVGEIAGVGNGNPSDMGSFKLPEKSTYQGKCLAIIRPSGEEGKILLKAKVKGLQETELEVTVIR